MMKEKIHMLKKVLRKLVTLTVTVATVATMAAPVSAATLTPKKSHSKAEITEYVDYLNDITDSWTFRADGYVPAFSVSDEDDSDEEKFSAEPGSIPYCFWQMSELLQNTPGIDDEQKADMKKAASKWKKSYMSAKMIDYYQWKWDLMYNHYFDSDKKYTASSCKASVRKTYNEINKYIAGKAKYNQKLAGELKKFNKQRLDIYNKSINNWFYKMSKKQKAKYGSTIFSGSSPTPAGARFDMYITSMFYKQKMDSTPWLGHSKSCSTNIDDYGDKYDYQWKVLKYHTFDFSPNGASELAGKHIRKYRTW